MEENLHVEIVSGWPGEHAVYLADPSGAPPPLEGAALEVALIDPAGNELFNVPASMDASGENLVAEGGPTDLAQSDVRVKVALPETAEPVEMDFTLFHQP